MLYKYCYTSIKEMEVQSQRGWRCSGWAWAGLGLHVARSQYLRWYTPFLLSTHYGRAKKLFFRAPFPKLLRTYFTYTYIESLARVVSNIICRLDLVCHVSGEDLFDFRPSIALASHGIITTLFYFALPLEGGMLHGLQRHSRYLPLYFVFVFMQDVTPSPVFEFFCHY